MTNREKINKLGGVLLEPEGSGSDRFFLMVSEKWLDSEYKESDQLFDGDEKKD